MKRFAYYNENDPYAADWLRGLIRDGLITDGEVDERSIADVSPDDVRGFARVHWFAGIGGWELALSLARYDRWDVVTWTGSCPCQPFSCAGSRAGIEDERHLWPEFHRLIRVCRPPAIFGEQVASAEVVGTELEAAFVVAVQAGEFARANKLAKQLARSKALHYHRRWLDGVHADLAGEGYAFRAEVLPAAGVGAPHIRQRLFWVADAGPLSAGRSHRPGSGDATASTEQAEWGRQAAVELAGRCGIGRLADLPGRGQRIDGSAPRDAGHADECGEAVGLGDGIEPGLQGHAGHEHDGHEPGRLGAAPRGPVAPAGAWDYFRVAHCRDGKARRVGTGVQPLAHGLPRGVGPGEPRTCGLGDLAEARASLKRAKRNRVGRLKAYGNAIAPELAAEFIAAYLESRP